MFHKKEHISSIYHLTSTFLDDRGPRRRGRRQAARPILLAAPILVRRLARAPVLPVDRVARRRLTLVLLVDLQKECALFNRYAFDS